MIDQSTCGHCGYVQDKAQRLTPAFRALTYRGPGQMFGPLVCRPCEIAESAWLHARWRWAFARRGLRVRWHLWRAIFAVRRAYIRARRVLA